MGHLVKSPRALPAIDPGKSALLVIDMQNAFVREAGPIFVPNAWRVLGPLRRVVNELRVSGAKVIWTRVSLGNVKSGIYPKLWPEHFHPDGTTVLDKGSYNFEIVEELRCLVAEQDMVIDKDRFSAFHQTNLAASLSDLGVEVVFFSGVVTNICVESSLRDAYHHDFIPILLSDCTATFSEELQIASEQVVSTVFGYTATSIDVLTALGRTL